MRGDKKNKESVDKADRMSRQSIHTEVEKEGGWGREGEKLNLQAKLWPLNFTSKHMRKLDICIKNSQENCIHSVTPNGKRKKSPQPERKTLLVPVWIRKLQKPMAARRRARTKNRCLKTVQPSDQTVNVVESYYQQIILLSNKRAEETHRKKKDFVLSIY